MILKIMLLKLIIEIEIKHSSSSSQYDDLVSKFLNLVATNIKTRGNFIKEYRKLSSCIFTKINKNSKKSPKVINISPSNTVPSGSLLLVIWKTWLSPHYGGKYIALPDYQTMRYHLIPSSFQL